MKFLSLFVVLLTLTSCSYYQAASHNSGKYTGVDVKGCSTNFLGIPFSPEKSRLDKILNENNIDHKEIYTVQNKTTHYLGDLLFENCTVVSLNEKGAKKHPGTSEKKSSSKTVEKFVEKDENRIFLFKGKNIKDMNDCKKVAKKDQAACRKKFFKLMNK